MKKIESIIMELRWLKQRGKELFDSDIPREYLKGFNDCVDLLTWYADWVNKGALPPNKSPQEGG